MKFRANVISLNVLDNSNPENPILASTLKIFATVDGAGKSHTLVEPVFVDHKFNAAKAESYLTAGYAIGSTINYDNTGVAEWVEGVDKVLPAKNQLPARQIHRHMGPITNLVVEDPRKAMALPTRQAAKADLAVAAIPAKAKKADKAMTLATKADTATAQAEPSLLDKLFASVGMTRKNG